MTRGQPHIAGAVLAGGSSRRFGADKALASVGDHTLLERTLDVLGQVCPHPYVIGRPPHLDRRPGLGPLAGLETALFDLPEAATHLVIVAVDMPGLSVPLLRALIEAPEADVVVPSHGGRLHPMCARWHRLTLHTVSAVLDDGRRSLHAALDRLHVRVLDDAALREAGVSDPARALANVNEPRDLQQFITGGLR